LQHFAIISERSEALRLEARQLRPDSRRVEPSRATGPLSSAASRCPPTTPARPPRRRWARQRFPSAAAAAAAFCMPPPTHTAAASGTAFRRGERSSCTVSLWYIWKRNRRASAIVWPSLRSADISSTIALRRSLRCSCHGVA
jgi:hypothetical protein